MNKYTQAALAVVIILSPHPSVAVDCISSKLLQTPITENISLPESLISKSEIEDKEPSITALEKELRNDLASSQNELENNSPFYGLYIIGSSTKRDSLDKGYLGLEWQLFRRGFFEGQRKADLNSTSKLIKTYNLQNKLRQFSLEQALHHSTQIQNTVLAYYYKHILSQQTRLTEIYQKRLPSGYTTRQELGEEETKRKILQSKLKYFELFPQTIITKHIAFLVNNIERLKLSPIVDLKKLAIARSGLKELQELHAKQAKLISPRWSDNLNLSIYTQKYQDYNGSEGTETGMQIDIPIGGNLNFDSNVKYRTHLTSLEISANKNHLLEKLAALSAELYYTQEEIEQLKNKYQLLQSNAKIYCKQARHIIPTLKETPEKLLEKMPIKLLEAQRDIVFSRIKAYQAFLKIESMVQPRQGEQWYLID